MNANELKAFWVEEEKRTFKGWDFSSIDDRSVEEPLPWSYREIVLSHLTPQCHLLDMGTGGGEFLLSLGHLHEKTAVTEAYLPNYQLCVETLQPLGIEVKLVEEDSNLPFSNEQFDLVINRHESYDLKEIYRILKPGGMFITQQVGRFNNYEFSKTLLQDFEREPIGKNDFKTEVNEAKNLGFNCIRSEEYFPYLRFYDVGALVYFAKIIEWEFPQFSVESCENALLKCHESIEKQGFVESTEHRYLIVARKE